MIRADNVESYPVMLGNRADSVNHVDVAHSLEGDGCLPGRPAQELVKAGVLLREFEHV